MCVCQGCSSAVTRPPHAALTVPCHTLWSHLRIAFICGHTLASSSLCDHTIPVAIICGHSLPSQVDLMSEAAASGTGSNAVFVGGALRIFLAAFFKGMLTRV